MKRLNFLKVVILITLVICTLALSTSCMKADAYNNKDAEITFSTEAPVAETPVAETPETQAPVTETPETETPETETPETEAPVTEAPAIEAPVTEAPATEAPVTEAPAIEAPETEVEVAVDTVAEYVAVETSGETTTLPPAVIDWSGVVDRYPNDWEFLGVEMHADGEVSEETTAEVERLIEGLSPIMRSLLRVVYLAVEYIPGEDAHEFAYGSDGAIFIVDATNMEMLPSYFYHELGHSLYEKYAPDPQVWEVETFCQYFDLYMRGIELGSMTEFITSYVEIETP